jgi:hypothetical protein
MSGLFLTLWDVKARDASPVLRPTPGGYPRISLQCDCNMDVAARLLREWTLRTVRLVRAYVVAHGPAHYNVVLELEPDVAKELTRVRATVTEEMLFVNLHVVHTGGLADGDEADRIAHELNTRHLPHAVLTTGVCFH